MRTDVSDARGGGFTLVELLVVISIIVLLIAILTPSLNQATALTRQATCQSNLAQLHRGYIAYGANSGGRLLPYICDSSRPEAFWMSALHNYYGNLDKIRDCPVITRRSYGWGSTTSAWGPCGGWMAGHSGSYAINGWMYDMMGWGNDLDYEILAVSNANEVPVWFDSAWVDAWPRETNSPPVNYDDIYTGWNDGGMGRLCIARHGVAINVGFADCSARKVALPDLWLLRWHLGYKPQHLAFPDPP